ncbi:MAG: beta-lactamase regulatory protein 1 [Paenibacillaceae bacterium]|nr:beta-lactamase regulatory protein 1 [Paenibacillaceae bacterium]
MRWVALGLVLAVIIIVWRLVGAAPALDAESAAPVSPLPLPEGFKQVETSLLALAVPEGWSVGKSGKELIFTVNGEKAGETETLDWFDAQSWTHIRPNHSEQTEFAEVSDIPAPAAGNSRDFRLYKIRLVHTKPAAQLDPDWHYDDTRWYWTDSGRKMSYGVYFNEAEVDEGTMVKVVSSIRLKADGK